MLDAKTTPTVIPPPSDTIPKTADSEKGLSAVVKTVSSHDETVVHDGIHDDLILATDDDLATLRRVPDSVPWRSYCECIQSLK